MTRHCFWQFLAVSFELQVASCENRSDELRVRETIVLSFERYEVQQ